MQLFGFRKTPDLSLAPLQASCLRDLRAQIWRRAVVGSSRPFAHSGKSAVHKRTCLNDRRLIVERRSLRAALRALVGTTEIVCVRHMRWPYPSGGERNLSCVHSSE